METEVWDEVSEWHKNRPFQLAYNGNRTNSFSRYTLYEWTGNFFESTLPYDCDSFDPKQAPGSQNHISGACTVSSLAC